jgi:RNA polymerase sigma factor (TIGR02999 family)
MFDESADRFFGPVYQSLRSIAHRRLRRQRPGETLSTTALVNEAYLRLVQHGDPPWRDRAHFCALAARAMRFILVDHARARAAAKREGRARELPLDAVQLAADERAAELLALDDARERLATLDPRLSEVVDYRFFAGMTFEEIAETTGRSIPTVKRDWTRARAWLYQEMQESETRPPGRGG